MLNILSVLSFEVDAIEPHCMNKQWDYTHNLVVQLALPLVLLAGVGLWIGCTYAIFK